AASAAVCARRSFEAATICIALVIFCVALVEAMRTRMSLSEAILSSHRRSDSLIEPQTCLSSCPAPCSASHVSLCTHAKTWTAGASPRTSLCKRLGKPLDHALQLGRRIVAEFTAVADGVEKIDILAPQHRQQPVLEAAHLVERKRVEIAIGARPDHAHLLFHLERRE